MNFFLFLSQLLGCSEITQLDGSISGKKQVIALYISVYNPFAMQEN
jgi:hypothetical protein